MATRTDPTWTSPVWLVLTHQLTTALSGPVVSGGRDVSLTRWVRLEDRHRDEADHRPCALPQATDQDEGRAGRSRQSEGDEGGHASAFERAQGGGNHEGGEAHRRAHRFQHESGGEPYGHARKIEDGVDLEGAHRPPSRVQQDRDGDARPMSPVEIEEATVHVAEQLSMARGRSHAQPLEDAARSRHAAAELHEGEATAADQLGPEEDGHGQAQLPRRLESEGGQDEPAATSRVCPTTTVVLSTMMEARAVWRGTRWRTRKAFRGSPPTEAVGVARLTASPANRAPVSAGQPTRAPGRRTPQPTVSSATAIT